MILVTTKTGAFYILPISPGARNLRLHPIGTHLFKVNGKYTYLEYDKDDPTAHIRAYIGYGTFKIVGTIQYGTCVFNYMPESREELMEGIKGSGLDDRALVVIEILTDE